jgi:hypothetical protein
VSALPTQKVLFLSLQLACLNHIYLWIFSSSSPFPTLYFLDHPPKRHFTTFVVIVAQKREEYKRDELKFPLLLRLAISNILLLLLGSKLSVLSECTVTYCFHDILIFCIITLSYVMVVVGS